MALQISHLKQFQARVTELDDACSIPHAVHTKVERFCVNLFASKTARWLPEIMMKSEITLAAHDYIVKQCVCNKVSNGRSCSANEARIQHDRTVAVEKEPQVSSLYVFSSKTRLMSPPRRMRKDDSILIVKNRSSVLHRIIQVQVVVRDKLWEVQAKNFADVFHSSLFFDRIHPKVGRRTRRLAVWMPHWPYFTQ
eukprot:1285355-Rhodomonas_salina.1